MNKNHHSVVGKSIKKLDGISLVTGAAKFTDDFEMRGMLYGKILFSPHAHARIRSINTDKAKNLPGVHAVITYKDIPRVPFTTAGQGHPEPSPYDTYTLDSKVRFIGDRVAAAAAETPEIAGKALELIEVDYEVLPSILDPEKAMEPGAPVIHDEKDSSGIFDSGRNLVAHVKAEVGNVKQGFAESDMVIENEYRVGYVQQSPLEPHVTITYLDEDNRLVIRTSTQVPFHVRRIVARVVGLPVSRVRVIKPRIGGGFGVKQEILLEDICSAITLASRKPVRMEYTREEELRSSRTRHPMILKMKTGINKDGTLAANQMIVLANTGAYGSHALTVPCNTGSKSLPLYRCPNMKYESNTVYTNLPVSGAFRGYGGPEGYFAMESHMDEVAHALKMDPLEFRQKNLIREGDSSPLAEVLGEGRDGFEQIIRTCGIYECIKKGAEAIGWERRKDKKDEGHIKRGIGVACLMHGSGIPGVDMGSVFIKMNDDGSFNLLMGATDLGTGSDTVLAQIAAEVLDIDPKNIVVYSSDTDLTPFDVGAYASSTTYITGQAVKKAAEQVREQIIDVAAKMLKESPLKLMCHGGKVMSTSGKSVTFAEVALESLYKNEMYQIMGTASHISYDCPPPFGAQFAEVEVDTETGFVRVVKFVSAIDCGRALNPRLAEGQIEGGVQAGLGYALSEEMIFDEKGKLKNTSFLDYKMFTSIDMPEMKTILVETNEPTGPFGAKSVSEIPIDGPAPAVANAIFNAIGIRMKELPFTPEKVLAAIKESRKGVSVSFDQFLVKKKSLVETKKEGS